MLLPAPVPFRSRRRTGELPAAPLTALGVSDVMYDPDADVLYNLAVALEDLGETREALITYARVIELDTDSDLRRTLAPFTRRRQAPQDSQA